VLGRAVRSLELELLELDRDRPFVFGKGEGETSEGELRMAELAGEELVDRGFVCSARRWR